MINDMEMATRGIQTTTGMKGNLNEEKLMAKESIIGTLVRFMTVSGKMELKKVTVFGRELMAIHILENGEILKLTVMEFIHGKMGTGMKENGTTA